VPGNVRELENIVEQLVVMAREPLLRREDLPATIRQEQRRRDVMVLPVGTTLEQIEQSAIRQTLAITSGDKEQAAALLGIHVATIYRKLSAEDLSQKRNKIRTDERFFAKCEGPCTNKVQFSHFAKNQPFTNHPHNRWGAVVSKH